MPFEAPEAAEERAALAFWEARHPEFAAEDGAEDEFARDFTAAALDLELEDAFEALVALAEEDFTLFD